MTESQGTEVSEGTYLMPGDAARMLGVSTATLAAIAGRGSVQFVTLPSGHRRYVAESVRALLESWKSA